MTSKSLHVMCRIYDHGEESVRPLSVSAKPPKQQPVSCVLREEGRQDERNDGAELHKDV